MQDLTVVVAIALGVGLPWAACLWVVSRLHGFPHTPKPDPVGPVHNPPAVTPIHTRECEFCNQAYDPQASLACCPELFCGEFCEWETLEQMLL